MDQTERVLGLVSEGLSPTRIAKEIHSNTGTVIQVISKAVSEGKLRRSEVLASFDRDWRASVDNWTVSGIPKEKIRAAIGVLDMPHDVGELELYLSYRSQRATAGDTYQLLSDVERTLHALIKSVLVKKYGNGDGGWWAKGVPDGVRISCAKNREQDQGYEDHGYAYTTLMNLWEIMEAN